MYVNPTVPLEAVTPAQQRFYLAVGVWCRQAGDDARMNCKGIKSRFTVAPRS